MEGEKGPVPISKKKTVLTRFCLSLTGLPATIAITGYWHHGCDDVRDGRDILPLTDAYMSFDSLPRKSTTSRACGYVSACLLIHPSHDVMIPRVRLSLTTVIAGVADATK